MYFPPWIVDYLEEQPLRLQPFGARVIRLHIKQGLRAFSGAGPLSCWYSRRPGTRPQTGCVHGSYASGEIGGESELQLSVQSTCMQCKHRWSRSSYLRSEAVDCAAHDCQAGKEFHVAAVYIVIGDGVKWARTSTTHNGGDPLKHCYSFCFVLASLGWTVHGSVFTVNTWVVQVRTVQCFGWFPQRWLAPWPISV